MPLIGDGFNHDEPGPWPAFADLLAATTLLFLVLFAAVAIPAIKKNQQHEMMKSSIDSLQLRLASAVPKDGSVSVRRVGDYLLIQIPESATFARKDYELSKLQARGKQLLRDLGDTLGGDQAFRLIDQIQVVGHASAEGGAEYNWRLSSNRATTISLFLVDSVGLSPCTVSALGRSHFFPADPVRQRSMRTADARDRRIELEVRPFLPDDSLQLKRRENECVSSALGVRTPQ